MIQFDKNICLETSDIKDCSIECMNAVGISKSIIDSVKLKVDTLISNLQNVKTNPLYEFYFDSNEYEIYFYP